MGCGICDFCVSGNTQLCPDYRAPGINIDGAFAEYVRVPAEAVKQGNVCTLGASITYEEAAIVEALSCVYNGSTACRIQPGDSVLIIGAGPIGIMHAKLAIMAGAAGMRMPRVALGAAAGLLPLVIVYAWIGAL
jgi:L-iditol 2-dehydrogenase